MPASTKPHVPVYRHHKPSGLASVRIDGRDIYLGRHGTPDSRAEYKRVITEWMANHKSFSPQSKPERILPGRAVGRDDFLDAHAFDALTEIESVDRIAIANQEAWRVIEREYFDDLLSGPTRRGVRGHAEMRDAAAVVAQHEEAVEQAETHRGDGKEVDRDDVADMILKECAPRLRRWLVSTSHVLCDGRLSDRVPKQSQFGLNARRAPKRILGGHSSNEFADLGVGLRSATFVPRLPAPIESEALAVPSDDGLGLHDHEARAPIRPKPGQPNPKDAVTIPQLRAFHRHVENSELLAQSQIFCGEGCTLEQARTNQKQDNADHAHGDASVRIL